MTSISQLVNTIETGITASALSALAISGYALSTTAINNAPGAGVAPISYDLCDMTLTLSAAVTTVAPAYLTVWVLPTIDGTNYPSTLGLAPISLSYTFQQSAGSNQTFICSNIPIPPYSFKLQIQNNLGVQFSATATCQIVRKSVSSF